jgi:hypothetical protein
MIDIATTLDAVVMRATAAVLDDVARDGLIALRKILDSAGFSESEYLKDYEVYAHIQGTEISFEIVLNIEAIVSEDEVTQKALEEQQKLAEEAEKQSDRSYHLSRNTQRVRRMRDMRRPARDARKPARDARKTSKDRLTEHELARLAPRSARVTRTGKLSVALKRSIRETEGEVKFPEGQFQGILGSFSKELQKVISDRFTPSLQSIIKSYVSG